MPELRKLRVFLCCTAQDKYKPFIRETYARLEDEGWIEPWLDDEKLLPGLNWDAEVEKAVGDADCVIIFISKRAIVENRYVQRELRFVLNCALENIRRSISIIPLRLDDCPIPRHVQPWQYYDFSVFNQREHVYKRLVNNLQIRANLNPNINSPSQSAHFISASDWNEKYGSAPEVLKDFDLIEIPAGKFLMGSKVANSAALDDEFPQHPCHIPYNYWITRFPITNEHFGEFAVSNKRTDVLIPQWRSYPNQPAVNVSWHQAVTYVNWLNRVFGRELEQGLVFRLPTEAEWERAARGDFGREWPWGNENLDQMIDRELAYAPNYSSGDDFCGSSEVSEFFAKIFKFDTREVYKVNSAVQSDAEVRWKFKSKMDYTELKKKITALRKKPDLVDVGSFSPLTDSPYEVADMMGNVIEWTQSLYEPYPYDAEDGRESSGGDGKRVLRGLFAPTERFSVRCAKRFCASPNEKYSLLGFRIVVAPPTSL
jgi:formylglycine-generating enzyme required for sulfatase activity